jgi:hypothetical protein
VDTRADLDEAPVESRGTGMQGRTAGATAVAVRLPADGRKRSSLPGRTTARAEVNVDASYAHLLRTNCTRLDLVRCSPPLGR